MEAMFHDDYVAIEVDLYVSKSVFHRPLLLIWIDFNSSMDK